MRFFKRKNNKEELKNDTGVKNNDLIIEYAKAKFSGEYLLEINNYQEVCYGGYNNADNHSLYAILNGVLGFTYNNKNYEVELENRRILIRNDKGIPIYNLYIGYSKLKEGDIMDKVFNSLEEIANREIRKTREEEAKKLFEQNKHKEINVEFKFEIIKSKQY